MLQRFFVAVFAGWFALTGAVALTVTQPDDQGFNQAELLQQIRDVTITVDTATPAITAAGGLRLVLPEDLPAIWDRSYSRVALTGSAVMAGRVADFATVTFENRAKVVVVPVKQDFVTGEVVTVSGLMLKGFYKETTLDQKLGLAVTPDNAVVAQSNKVLYVRHRNTDDNNTPEAPDSLAGKFNGAAVTLTWADSVDRDVTEVEIHRAAGSGSLTRYSSVSAGAQTFTDTGVALGTSYTYAVRASDGRNFSPLSSTVKVETTLVTTPAGSAVCTADYAPVCGSDGKTYSNTCQATAAGATVASSGVCATPAPTPTAAELELATKAAAAGTTLAAVQAATAKFPDLPTTHFAVGFLARLLADATLAGYPDGTARPDQLINRAELAKLVVKTFALPTEVSSAEYPDVPTDSWFAPFINALAARGAAWTAISPIVCIRAPCVQPYAPASPVTRAEAVWVLAHAAGATLVAPTAAPFPDVAASEPTAAAIAWAKARGIATGYESGLFGPRDTLTRGQLAKLLVLARQLGGQ